MSEEKKEFGFEEMHEITKDINKDSDWDGSWWIIVLLLFFGFGGFASRDTTDHELRERVARLEGQMDIVGRRDK